MSPTQDEPIVPTPNQPTPPQTTPTDPPIPPSMMPGQGGTPPSTIGEPVGGAATYPAMFDQPVDAASGAAPMGPPDQPQPNPAAVAPGLLTSPPVDPAQPPQKKKKKGWLIAVIIVVAVALVATIGYFGVRAVVGNRMSSYCQTYVALSKEMTGLSENLNTAAASGDPAKVSSAMGAMADEFTKLQDANPPQSVAVPLNQFVDVLNDLKTATDDNGFEGFLTTFNDRNAEMTQTGQAIDDESVAYCN